MAQTKIPAPIDRPLSKAYLREFTGWSTEFPPGLSDPTSLRLMENVMINRDGSARVRPGLRFLSYGVLPTDDLPGEAFGLECVGTHEVFFLNDGSKAYLFAVRELDGTVGFRVLQLNNAGSLVITLAEADFDVPQTEAILNFGPSTTYVKYVQIDNKIFALSNAGEAMRLFNVGSNKVARKLTSVERPDWATADKLSIVHPDAVWILGGTPISTRRNLFRNPSFEGPLTLLSSHPRAQVEQVAGDQMHRSKALRIRTTPTRTNYAGDPLTNIPFTPVDSWWKKGVRAASIGASGGALRVNVSSGAVNRNSYLDNPRIAVSPGEVYWVAFDAVGASNNVQNFRIAVDFYNASGSKVGETIRQYGPDKTFNRHVFGPFTVPPNAVSFRPQPYANIDTKSSAWWSLKNVAIVKDGESTSVFSGDSGTGYYWTGTPYESPSIFHPEADAYAITDNATVVAGTTYTVSASVMCSDVKDARIGVRWYDASGALVSWATSTTTSLATPSVYTRLDVTDTAPVGAVTGRFFTQVDGLARDQSYFTDAIMLEPASSVDTYFDGNTASVAQTITGWDGTPDASSSTSTTYDDPVAPPTAETPTADTLISSDPEANDFSFGFFYSFSNEIGESAASQITQIKAQRPWSQWLWVKPDTNGDPTTTPTMDADEACDQFTAIIPEAAFDQAVSQGATHWTLYALTWSDQEVVPTTAVQVGTKSISDTPDYDLDGWIRVTSQSFALSEEMAPLPTESSRFNYSNPSRAGQGLVASDRMILVYDPVDAAVIRWSSNLQGDYTNFTASKGGGYKTLTSGNLFVPACVKLWQNPQSVDTLTVLCMGVDGYSTGYYMAPAQVAQQSEATNIMGFEETTATPGTTSPYGCEVLNNALYHPLDEQLMKSTANNYNISHKSMTEQIQRQWSQLARKHQVVSSQLDNRLYYIVNNPNGEPVQVGQNGNEVWVLDTATDGGTWSRWLVQGHSLRKIEYGGQVYMSLVSKNGIYFFDPGLSMDDYVDADGLVQERPIPWLLETNTQGANRAHDAWCRLQQAQILVGNFVGTMRYGIRSWDLHGQPVEVSKIIRNLEDVDIEAELPFDYEDQLRIGRDLKEWFLFAESVTDEDGAVLHSSGQVSAVQYRYTPVTVNVGYDYGSVETFEYARATANWSERTTDNGVPTPFNDTRRP